MGSSRSFAVRTRAYEQEWADAALVEQVELLEAQLASLETERSRLETELFIAQSWVKELALWLDEAQLPTEVKPLPGGAGEDLDPNAQLDQLTARHRLAHELNERKQRITAILDALHEKAEASNRGPH